MTKRIYSYYSAIIIYIIRIIIMIYFLFDLMIKYGFVFPPIFFITILTAIYIGIFIYIKNRKTEFR